MVEGQWVRLEPLDPRRHAASIYIYRMAQPYLRRPPGRPPREGRVWCHELRYRADSWEHARRVVLVVVERPGELFVDHFWLITNLRRDRYSGARLLGLYRMRGKAEGHMGELMDVLAPTLSSAARPKSHYRGRRLETDLRAEEPGVRPQNETLLLLNLLAYGVLHAGRCVMQQATGTGWSLRRLRATGAASGQPRGPPRPAADVHACPAGGRRLAAPVGQAGGLELGIRLTRTLRLHPLPTVLPWGCTMPP